MLFKSSQQVAKWVNKFLLHRCRDS